MFDKAEANYLDLTRFIGIYLVVLGHFGFLYKDAYIGSMIYSFHMPLFFVISGILHKYESNKKRALGRYFYSLIIPYFIYNLICLLYLVVVKHDYQSIESVLLGSFVYFDSQGVWYNLVFYCSVLGQDLIFIVA